ncbi:MAG: hypothetical protein GF421_05490 [Candidatus Aminicenantes bacterium]|nr:hypothetical protein [Candidatus Aminicenantes bacterium]
MKTKLKNMPYPGRVIIIGKDLSGRYVITLYAVTGRSASSQARKIEYSQNRALVKPIDIQKVRNGDPDLLIYPAVIVDQLIAVSNGRQTLDIHKQARDSSSSIKALVSALKSWDYEPDPPTYTPRISGCILHDDQAALSIIKRADNGGSIKNFFECPLIPGKGRLISTYEGNNTDPLPPYRGKPVELDLKGESADQTAHDIFRAMKPAPNQPDLRVALVCVFSSFSELQKSHVSIINRHQRRK